VKRDYQTLDAIVIVMAMSYGGFILWALTFIKIPESQLPIMSGMGGTIVGIVLTYAAFRWQGSSDKSHPAAGTASVSIQATTESTKELEQ
jgi:hypothetical protein